MILITGGTGLVGSHLLYKLVSNNEKVRAIYRRAHKLDMVKKVFSYYTEDVETLYNKIDWVEVDLNTIDVLSEAFKDVQTVYHCAAFVTFEPDKYHQLRKINIVGTANIVNLCIANNIKKLCYVSSVAAIGLEKNPDQLITEETLWNTEEDNGVYAITKYGAEIEVWRGTQEGLDAVIVNPGVILGPGYWKGGGSSSLIHRIYKGFSHYTNGVTSYVDVWDVVEVMHQLMNSSIKNERFIVISDNLSYKDLQLKTAEALGVKSAKKEASTLLLEIGWRLDWLNHKLRGKRRKLTKQLARIIRTKTAYDNSKIISALDYKFNDIEGSIKRVSAYYIKDLEQNTN